MQRQKNEANVTAIYSIVVDTFDAKKYANVNVQYLLRDL